MSLSRNHEAWLYLKSRGIKEETVERFSLGYSKEALADYLISKGYDWATIINKGLYKGDISCFKPGRIIFPVKDDRGNIANLTSRVLPQYETFVKHKHLTGRRWMFYDPQSCKPGEDVCVVEGPFDRLILEQAGINAICFFGTCGYKREYWMICNASTIYCIPDSDGNPIAKQANFKTYVKMADAIYPDTDIRIISLPQKSMAKVDPSSYFGNMNDIEIENEINDLKRKSVSLFETREWNEYTGKEKERKEKRIKKRKTITAVDNLLNAPILEVLQWLGATVQEFGNRYRCRCINPEHEDKNPSMVIYPETNTFYCFACKTSGDAIGAVSIVKGTNFVESCNLIKENNLCPGQEH